MRGLICTATFDEFIGHYADPVAAADHVHNRTPFDANADQHRKDYRHVSKSGGTVPNPDLCSLRIRRSAPTRRQWSSQLCLHRN